MQPNKYDDVKFTCDSYDLDTTAFPGFICLDEPADLAAFMALTKGWKPSDARIIADIEFKGCDNLIAIVTHPVPVETEFDFKIRDHQLHLADMSEATGIRLEEFDSDFMEDVADNGIISDPIGCLICDDIGNGTNTGMTQKLVLVKSKNMLAMEDIYILDRIDFIGAEDSGFFQEAEKLPELTLPRPITPRRPEISALDALLSKQPKGKPSPSA